MDFDVYHWLASDNGYAVHAGVLAMLLLGGIGVPIPEDIPLFLAGLAAAKGIVSFQAIFVTAYLGVLTADLMVFTVGFFWGPGILKKGTKSRFIPALTEDKLAEVRDGLRRNRLLYIFISRHLFPIRSVTFLAAGALRVPFLEFLAADAIAALVSVNIMVWLGYFLGETLTPEALNKATHDIHLYLLGVFVVLVIIYLVGKRLRRGSKTEHPPPCKDSLASELDETNVSS